MSRSILGAMKNAHIVSLKQVPELVEEKGAKFGHRRRRLGHTADGRGLGCSWYELPAGKQAFPHHFHCAMEEAFYILSGEGEFRLGTETHRVTAGDYVACPPGPEGAHSLVNTGTQPLAYLAMSTMPTTDVVVYPDSKKVAFVGGVDPKVGFRSAWVAKIVTRASALTLWCPSLRTVTRRRRRRMLSLANS